MMISVIKLINNYMDQNIKHGKKIEHVGMDKYYI